MSRSAADATRFTATGPYANSKTAGAYQAPDFGKKQSSTKSSPQQLGPNGQPETPKEKVERLRAQARAARKAQAAGSGADRWIESGRKFANKAHKGMVYSLIAASGMFPAPWNMSKTPATQHTIEVRVSDDNQRTPHLTPTGLILILLGYTRCLRCSYSLLNDLAYAL